MRARVLAVLILLTAAPVLPQCNIAPVLSDPFRSSILDLAVDGNDLWAATSYGVSLYDRSVDPPALVATLAVPGTTRAIRVVNGTAYAASGNTIAIVRKNGRALQLVRTIDAGAPVNDIAVASALFVATANGIAQYDLLNFAPLQVATTPATSFALDSSHLYAAGGTPNIDVYSLTPIVQRTSTLTAPANITTVHVNNAIVIASSLVQTYLIVNGAVGGTLPFALTSLAPIAGDVIFAGGNDRALRGIDLAAPGAPVDVFRDDLAPSNGTINRVTSIAVAGTRAYAGAGDIGIVEYDIAGFTAPFPLRSLPFANASSILSLGDKFYAGTASGITEFKQDLTRQRTWDNKNDTVQDGANGLLLTSSGPSITLWALGNSIPASAGSATFAAPVANAVLAGAKVFAVLTSGTAWSVDLSQQTPVPSQIPGVQATSIARSGDNIAFAENRSDGTTLVTLSGGGSVSVPGLSTTPLTLSGTTAAVQTFRGISLVDLVSGTTIVLPNSNDVIAQQLLLSGTTLLELTPSTLRVWNTQSGLIAAELALPAAPLAMHLAPGSTMVDIATASGVATVALDRIVRMPEMIPSPNANAFYRKVIASSTRIGLIDARGVDLYTPSMQYAGSVRGAGIVDAAAGDNAIYTVTGTLALASWSTVGTPLASTSIDEPDSQAVAVNAVNGVPWVSTVHCSGGSCDKKTIIFDHALTRTIFLTGAIVDLVTSGNRAYAITDTPAEIRVLDISDPAHPSILASRPVDGTANSIAYSSGTIYVLGSGLSAYSESSLTKIADILSATASPDEHIRIDGNCAIITGRDASPQLFTLPQFAPATSFATPATPHSLAAQPGTFFVLTDDSLEIWSASPLPSQPRRHPAR